YKSYSKNESRVPNILSYYGLEFEENNTKIYDFEKCDCTNIKIKLEESKEFLCCSLGIKDE
ncbi:MAG: hypothetical protein ACLUIS_08030, partial [Longibaculum sp.]